MNSRLGPSYRFSDLVIWLRGAAFSTDNYQRQKDCSIQAEKIVRETGETILQNHYNPKTEHCYVYTMNIVKQDGTDYNWWILYDGFKKSQLANRVLAYPNKKFYESCIVNGVAVSYREFSEYVNKLLENGE